MREAQLRIALATFGTLALLSACGKESTSSAQSTPRSDQIVPAEAPSSTGMNSQQPAAAAAASADNGVATTAGSSAGNNGANSASNMQGNSGSSGSQMGMAASGNSGSQSNSSASASTSLSDAQIAGITHAANASEIEQAKVARTRAKSPKVKQFADMMLAQHQAAEQQQAKLGIQSADSPVETQLDQDASDVLNRLKSTSASDFDREYIDAQVKQHQQLLSMIDNQLLPSVKSTTLKTYIEHIRSNVEMHLKHAQDDQRALEATSSRDSSARGAGASAAHSGSQSSPSSSNSSKASAARQ